MNIPLDRLYHYLESLSGDDTLIYRFYPHGSKKITDLHRSSLHWPEVEIDKTIPYDIDQGIVLGMFSKPIIFHDQEPLDFNLYANADLAKDITYHLYDRKNNWLSILAHYDINQTIGIVEQLLEQYNLRLVPMVHGVFHAFDKCILVHSEKKSTNVKKYQNNGCIPVYWWSHAIIAQDWFRYANIDPMLKKDKTIRHDFLIYNRSWSGTREYRLKFVDLLLQNNLQESCLTKFNPYDNNIHYTDHKFKNPQFYIDKKLENTFDINKTTSCASADYDHVDYNTTRIEVVLETLFDDQRIHLTEKTLRPIACGHPFILAATSGSLEYLKSYGFKTFAPYIDESYDNIQDPLDRLQAIIFEMQRIKSLPDNEKQLLSEKINEIARENKIRFFSPEFSNSIIEEYMTNLSTAKTEIKQQCTGQTYRSLATTVYQDFNNGYRYLQQQSGNQFNLNAKTYYTNIHRKNQ